MSAPHLSFELTESSLAAAVQEIADAINNQDLSITSPAWRHVSPSLICDFSFSEWPRRTTSLQEMLDNFVLHFQRHPEYQIDVVNMSFRINNISGSADVFANLEVKGLPSGVVRPSIGTLSFVRSRDGTKWEWVRYVNLPGMAVVVGEGNGFER